jgi:hypothetical protein
MLRPMAGGTSAASNNDAFVGPRNVLAGLAIVALAAVIGLELRPVGSGESERPDHVLLALSSERVDVEQTLRDAGFQVEVQMLPSSSSGPVSLEDLLDQADDRGLGFLVVDDASNLDPGSVEFEGETWPEKDSWVAISVGDLAFPAHLSATSAGVSSEGGPSLGVLEMIFAQPRLDRERESLVRRPALDEVLLNARLEAGMNILDRATSQRRLSVEMELRLAERLAGDPDIAPVLEPLHIGGALPVGPRSLLTTARAVNFVIAPDSNLDDVLEDTLSLSRVDLDAAGRVVSREDCAPTVGGSLSAAEFQSLRASPEYEFLALQRRDGRVEFYRSAPSAVCRYTLAGKHQVQPGVDAGVLGVRGVLAGTELAGEGARVAFRALDGTTRVSPVVRATLRSPVWLDDSHVLVPGSDDALEPGVGAALYVFSALDETFVEKIELPEEIARRGVSSVVISNAREREVVMSSGRGPTDLYLARLGDLPDASAAVPAPAATGTHPERVRDRRVVHPVEEVSLMWSSDDSYDLDVSAGGDLLVFAAAGDEFRDDHGVRSRRYETRGIDLRAARRGALREERLASSGLNDRKPVIAPGKAFLVVSSRLRLGVRRREIVTPRVLRILPELEEEATDARAAPVAEKN